MNIIENIEEINKKLDENNKNEMVPNLKNRIEKIEDILEKMGFYISRK